MEIKKPSLKLKTRLNKTKCFYLSALTDSSIKSLASISACGFSKEPLSSAVKLAPLTL
jgi:hypothetical protein